MLLCRHIAGFVQPHATSDAYLNLINRRVDLVFSARLPSNEELRLAGELGVELDARPVALDAFVFLRSGENPVTSLTIEQLRDIYSGRIVNWREVGGLDAPIRPYQRPRNSGSQALMQTMVMKGRAMTAAPDLLIGTHMSSPFLALDRDVHGIGYSVYYYQEFMSPYMASIKAIAVEGVLPSPDSIRSRRYPFPTEVYVVVRRDLLPEHPAYRLRDWLLGPTGQAVVEESGYVPAFPQRQSDDL
jgi:phosphate transport system substrate-binding protein